MTCTYQTTVARDIGKDGCCNRSYFSYAIEEQIVGFFSPRMSNTTAEDCSRALDYNYTPWPHLNDTDMNRDRLVKVDTGLIGVRNNRIFMIKTQAPHNSVEHIHVRD